MRSERFNFPNATGEQLAATPRPAARQADGLCAVRPLFHLRQGYLAAKRIAERLTLHGIAVLRFDFTGLGASEGEFANTHFPRTSTT